MKALLLINDRAGSFSGETIRQSVIDILRQWQGDWLQRVIIHTVDAEHPALAVVHAHVHQIDRVIAAGGDGTIAQVIAAIRPYPHLKLGILPVGTGNRLASNLGLPLTLREALQVALTGDTYRMDVGRINQQYFALMAGAGIDADIMQHVQPIEKKTLGVLAYFWQGVKRAFQVPFTVYEVEVDGQLIRCRGVGVVVANAGNLLGRYFTLTPGAQVDDGLLDVCILATRNRGDFLPSLIQILSQVYFDQQQPGIRHIRGKRIKIRSRPRVRVQADGDVIGMTPIEIEAIPDAIEVLVPPTGKVSRNLMENMSAITERLSLMLLELLQPKAK